MPHGCKPGVHSLKPAGTIPPVFKSLKQRDDQLLPDGQLPTNNPKWAEDPSESRGVERGVISMEDVTAPPPSQLWATKIDANAQQIVLHQGLEDGEGFLVGQTSKYY